MSSSSIKQIHARMDGSVLNHVSLILENGGTQRDIESMFKVLEQTITDSRKQIDMDQKLLNIGSELGNCNLAATNEHYNECVRLLLLSMKLLPNPLTRNDLRVKFYDTVLNPTDDIDWEGIKLSIDATITRLNGNIPYEAKKTNSEGVSKWDWFKKLFRI